MDQRPPQFRSHIHDRYVADDDSTVAAVAVGAKISPRHCYCGRHSWSGPRVSAYGHHSCVAAVDDDGYDDCVVALDNDVVAAVGDQTLKWAPYPQRASIVVGLLADVDVAGVGATHSDHPFLCHLHRRPCPLQHEVPGSNNHEGADIRF